MIKIKLMAALLDLFEGGDGGAASGDSSNTSGVAGQKSGDLSKVVYGNSGSGKAAAAQDAAGSETSSDDRQKQWESMINGDFKDLYTKSTQQIIDKRFKQTKNLEDTVKNQDPIMQMLYQRYKVEAGDHKSLIAALESDDAYWTDAADEAGMTVDQYKEFSKLKRDHDALEQEKAQREQQDRANAQLQEWFMQGEELKKTFPSFDLNAESQNPDFVSLLRKGLNVSEAFRLLHMDEIVTETMKTAASAAEKRVTNNVRARGTRPAENGTAAQSAFTIKNDVRKLTKADRAEIARRVARGEEISF